MPENDDSRAKLAAQIAAKQMAAPKQEGFTEKLNRIGPKPSPGEGERMRQITESLVRPQWPEDVGGGIGKRLAAGQTDESRARLSSLARRYVDLVDPAAAQARQDEEIAENNRKLEILKKYASQQPVDGRETDAAPAPRQPIQMQREFSNDQEKEAYLDRIRQAQKNAAKK